MFSTIQLHRDTAANWTAVNPVLHSAEIGVETDTLKFKIGNGSSAWNALAYATSGSSGISILDTATVDLILAGTVLSANVLPAGVNHDALLNYVANKHIDHTGVTVTAGTGMTGGGNISSTITLNCAITQYTDALSRAAFSNTTTGLTYTSGTGVLSLTAGYVIPTTTQESNWGSAYSAMHTRSHSITSASDHTGNAAASGYMLQGDAGGLPVIATNTNAEVSAAVTASHAQGTDTGTTSNTFQIDSDSILGKFIFDVLTGAANKSMTFTNDALTGDRIITFQNDSGTVAFTAQLHTQGTDTTLGTMTEDIDMNNSYQVVNLQLPGAAGEAIRQTAIITETALEDAVNGKRMWDNDLKMFFFSE